MLQVGDTVLYGTNGACRIEEVMVNDFGECFVLVPLFIKRTRITVPKNNEALVSRMRPVPEPKATKKQLKATLKIEPTWVSDEPTRKSVAKEVIAGDDDMALLQLIRAFYLHKQRMQEEGKKFHVSDENILKTAEQKLNNEYAVVFNIAPEEVPDLIASLR